MSAIVKISDTELILFFLQLKGAKLCLQESIKLIFHHPMK